MFLRNVAKIRTGVFAKPDRAGEILYLQAKHFDEFGNLASHPSPELKEDRSVGKHLLKPGDVLFAAKGTKNFAAVYSSELPAVASTTFFVLTSDSSVLLPEYLAWKLNDPSTLGMLKKNAIGSSLVSIPKSLLEDLEINIPSIEKQRLVVEIDRLSRIENGLRMKIAEHRQNLTRQLLADATR